MKQKQIAEDFERGRQHLDKLKALQAAGWIQLFYFDESGFSLTSCLPYAWQKKGETIGLLPEKGKRLNVGGFYSVHQDFIYQVQQTGFNQQQLITLFDRFAENISQKTVVVLDNAPAHHGKAFRKKIQQWKEKDLYLYYLPAYSPELNLIEILWRRIKYSWLSFAAYQSFEKLQTELDNILRRIGQKYTLNYG